MGHFSWLFLRGLNPRRDFAEQKLTVVDSVEENLSQKLALRMVFGRVNIASDPVEPSNI